MKLAVAVAGCPEGATHSHVRQALDAGMPAADLRHVAVLTASTLGFPAMHLSHARRGRRPPLPG